MVIEGVHLSCMAYSASCMLFNAVNLTYAVVLLEVAAFKTTASFHTTCRAEPSLSNLLTSVLDYSTLEILLCALIS